MKEINSMNVYAYIRDNPGQKLAKILDGFEIPPAPKDSLQWRVWYDSTYKAMGISLAALKTMQKIEYRKGGPGIGGWFIK